MRVAILDEAERDLMDGFRFYEMQDNGLGDYFLDSLFSDIDSLALYDRIDFRLRSTTPLMTRLPASGPFWIAVRIPRGLKEN